jgi:hypothetical protein
VYTCAKQHDAKKIVRLGLEDGDDSRCARAFTALGGGGGDGGAHERAMVRDGGAHTSTMIASRNDAKLHKKSLLKPCVAPKTSKNQRVDSNKLKIQNCTILSGKMVINSTQTQFNHALSESAVQIN